MRIVFLLLVLSTLSLKSLSAAEVLTIAAEDEAAPWSYTDGSGYANDLVTAAFKAVGIDVKLEVMPYARCKKMVMAGEIAACFSMSRAPELEGTVLLSEKPLFVCFAEYFENTSAPLNAKTEAELPKGTVVGSVVGYEYPPSLYKLKGEGKIALEEAATEELNVKKLADKRIQAALINHNSMKLADYVIAQAGATGKVRLACRSGILDSFIGFSRKHAKGTWAYEKFNEGFKIISADGTLQKIHKKWESRAQDELKALLAKTQTK